MKHNPSDAELKRFGDFVGKCLAMLAFTNNEEIQDVMAAVATLVLEKFDHPILLAWALYGEESALENDVKGMGISLNSIMIGASNPREMKAQYALLCFDHITLLKEIDLVAWTQDMAKELKKEN